MGSLTRAVNALLGTAEQAACTWWEEPGEYRWLFRRQADRLHITILEFDQTGSRLPDERGRVLFSAECRMVKFAIQVKTQLRELLETHGVEGYQALWVRSPFPMDEYVKLQGLLRGWQRREQK